MTEINSIYDNEGRLVGRFSDGIAWSSPENIRLGKYDDEFVYENDSSMLAKVCDDHVLNIIGEEIGRIHENKIYISHKKVGSFIGSVSAGTAAVALIFNKGAVNGS